MGPRSEMSRNVAAVAVPANGHAANSHAEIGNPSEHRGERQGMWTRAQVLAHIAFLQRRVAVFTAYRDECIAIGTRHGVIDAECDMREFDAQIAVLREVLHEEAPGPRVCG